MLCKHTTNNIILRFPINPPKEKFRHKTKIYIAHGNSRKRFLIVNNNKDENARNKCTAFKPELHYTTLYVCMY